MFSIQQGDLLATLQQLKQALYNHEQWHKDLTRSLICRLPHDARDMQADAHRRCRFGQWFYSAAPAKLREHGGFLAMEAEHTRMHQYAAQLLLSLERTGAVATADYDNFSNALERLCLQLHSLIDEFETALYRLDPLTGAESRVNLLTTLRQAHALIKRDAQAYSIAILDLDHFKEVNDRYGHVVGDHVLAAAVRLAKTYLRPYDRIFRYGGEEFLIFLPNTDLPAAMAVMERIRAGLETRVLTHAGGMPVTVTASFGVAPLQAENPVEDSIDQADHALYAAKQAGRNRGRAGGQ